jgi:hypothetical protein
MTSDRYLKAVLTVIAGCLVYICIALTTGPAVSAQNGGPQEVVLVGWKVSPGHERTIMLPPDGGATSQPLPVRER